MELLEFKNKMLELCNARQVEEIGDILLNVVLSHDVDFFERYNEIADNTKDWLQALFQYYSSDRAALKQDYTPRSLSKLVAVLGGKAKTLYDCCGGSGSLAKAFIRQNGTEEVFVEELDERVIPFLLFNLCLENVSGTVVNGDALSRERKMIYRLNQSEEYSAVDIVDAAEAWADVAISNPPFNIKWEPPLPLDNDTRFPVIPPASNANFAFVFNCLAKAKEKAVLILPSGVTSESAEQDVRQYLVDNDLVEAVMIMPNKMFESTDISTCLLVLNKHKKHKNEVIFIDNRKNCETEERQQNGQFGGASHERRTYKKSFHILADENIAKITTAIGEWQSVDGFCAVKTNQEISAGDYLLIPSRFIAFEAKEDKHRDFQEIADNINYIVRMQNACKLVINETTAKNLGLDVELFRKSAEEAKEMQKQMKQLGIAVECEDYIQFTKNKNELCFKCNDKEMIPEIFIQFLSVWKNQIALLNTMANQYLAELRDALLPELMSGKVQV